MIVLKAPRNQFRVVGVDTFDGDSWVIGDFDTKDEAIQKADENGGTMLKAHVYNDDGKHIYQAGTF